jgi:SAM-dependent methyltransferase
MNKNFDKPTEDFNYYRQSIYWNDFLQTRNMINRKISGSPETDWAHHCKNLFDKFDHCLVPNMGNGWVERNLFNIGLISSVFGFDINEASIAEATAEADKIGMPAQYAAKNCNNVTLPKQKFDLVVNCAAMHHVAYINRLTRILSESLKPDGKYIAFDYVGTHRNQYPWEVWSAVVELNEKLPQEFKNDLIYPHLKTMIHMDPTEAIHSELQVEMLNRYFHVIQYTPLGGALAYPLLNNNNSLYDARETPQGMECINMILEADNLFVSNMPQSNLFSFWIASPLGGGVNINLQAWQHEEDMREKAALQNKGRYYPRTALEILTDEISDLRYYNSIIEQKIKAAELEK